MCFLTSIERSVQVFEENDSKMKAHHHDKVNIKVQTDLLIYIYFKKKINEGSLTFYST